MPLVWKTKPPAGSLDEEGLAQALRALGHPKRLRIVQTLLRQERTLCGQLAEELELAQSTVSQHLAILLDAGILSVEAEGTKRWYRLRPGTIERIRLRLGEWPGPRGAAPSD